MQYKVSQSLKLFLFIYPFLTQGVLAFITKILSPNYYFKPNKFTNVFIRFASVKNQPCALGSIYEINIINILKNLFSDFDNLRT